MREKITELISVALIVIILYASSWTVISYATETYKTATELESQGTVTTNENVEFDVYYAGGTHTNSIDVTNSDTEIFIKAKVKNAGYLENAKIDLSACNFNISNDETNIGKIQSFDGQGKIIVLNRIVSGNEVEISINITSLTDDRIDPEGLKKDNNIKFTGTYVNEKAKEEQISKDIVLHTEWFGDSNVSIQSEIEKSTTFDINGNTGVLVETKITTGLKNRTMPIKESKVTFTIPSIYNENPQKVFVYAKSTENTNGEKTAINFTDSNYTYDEENGTVTITVTNNPGTDGKISWAKDKEDEYRVVTIYSSTVKEKMEEAKTLGTVDLKCSLGNKYYGIEKNGQSLSYMGNGQLSKKSGSIIDFEAGIEQSEVYKGYMYRNKITSDENKRETPYTEKMSANISYANLVDEIVINQNVDNFITVDNASGSTTVDTENYTYNKSVKMNKSEFTKILGETGYIDILSNQSVIERIDNTKEANSDGNIIIDISAYNTNNIQIKTSKPQKEGTLCIEIEKAIAKEVSYSKEQIESFKELKTSMNLTALSGTTEVTSVRSEDKMNLIEPMQKISLSINKQNLSAVVTNAVEITALLETDTADDKLCTDPKLTISFPSEIKNINIKNIELFHTDELTLGEHTIIEDENGKSLQINITGTQTKYSDIVTKGISLLIYADLELDKTTPTSNDQISMKYGAYEEDASSACSIDISLIAPAGLVTVNEYKSGETSAIVVNDEKGIINLDINAEAKTANIKGEIINNYDNTISEVNILGRIPSKESLGYDTIDKAGNTFDVALNDAITLTGIEGGYTIYYSTNAETSRNLADTNNGWTTQVIDYSLVKSYLIVIDAELARASDISWNYNVQIPANLGYKSNVTSNYKVYIKNNSASGQVEEGKESPVISLETERGPELEATISSIDVENGGIVTKGMRITVEYKVSNTGSQTMKDVKIEMPIPDKMEYNSGNAAVSINAETGNLEYQIDSLEPDTFQSLNVYFLCSEVGNTKVLAKILSSSFEGYIEPEEYNIIIDDAELALINVPASKEENYIKVGVSIKNLKTEKLNNIEIKYILPEGIKYRDYEVEENIGETVNYNPNENVVYIKIKSLEAEENKLILINVIAERGNKDNLYTIAKSTQNGKEYISNKEKIEVFSYDYTLTAINPGKQYIKNGDEITSIFTIENTSDTYLEEVKLAYKIPDGTEFVSGNIEYNNNNYTILESEENKREANYILARFLREEKAIVTIKLKVNLQESMEEQEIESYIEASNIIVGNKKSETITYIMKAKEENIENTIVNGITDNEVDNNNEIVKPGDEEKDGYEINGKIWIDANKDGKYDEGEESVSGISIILINKDSGEIILTTITNEKGRYVLDELEEGNYLVGFLYDSSKYVITAYQKEGVNSFINSDAITANINYNGKDRTVGLTDTLKITDADINNIDLGIYKAEEFDLSLEKYVSKVTVNNGSGVIAYDYNGKDKTLAKVDISEKYMASSTVIIEYKIVVKNEGEVAGYARKIVDYLPEDLRFSTELNPGAYLGKDGNIYSEELADTLINPGESKEIKIILTKKMTNTNTGTVVNEAEIAESYNELGLKDINSEAGNKDEKENDLGVAKIIITVKTGQAIIYTTLIATVIVILSTGIYLIRKYVIKN